MFSSDTYTIYVAILYIMFHVDMLRTCGEVGKRVWRLYWRSGVIEILGDGTRNCRHRNLPLEEHLVGMLVKVFQAMLFCCMHVMLCVFKWVWMSGGGGGGGDGVSETVVGRGRDV